MKPSSSRSKIKCGEPLNKQESSKSLGKGIISREPSLSSSKLLPHLINNSTTPTRRPTRAEVFQLPSPMPDLETLSMRYMSSPTLSNNQVNSPSMTSLPQISPTTNTNTNTNTNANNLSITIGSTNNNTPRKTPRTPRTPKTPCTPRESKTPRTPRIVTSKKSSTQKLPTHPKPPKEPAPISNSNNLAPPSTTIIASQHSTKSLASVLSDKSSKSGNSTNSSISANSSISNRWKKTSSQALANSSSSASLWSIVSAASASSYRNSNIPKTNSERAALVSSVKIPQKRRTNKPDNTELHQEVEKQVVESEVDVNIDDDDEHKIMRTASTTVLRPQSSDRSLLSDESIKSIPSMNQLMDTIYASDQDDQSDEESDDDVDEPASYQIKLPNNNTTNTKPRQPKQQSFKLPSTPKKSVEKEKRPAKLKSTKSSKSLRSLKSTRSLKSVKSFKSVKSVKSVKSNKKLTSTSRTPLPFSSQSLLTAKGGLKRRSSPFNPIVPPSSASSSSLLSPDICNTNNRSPLARRPSFKVTAQGVIISRQQTRII